MRFVKLSARESARLTINAVLVFWQQARIPTRYEVRCCEKILKLYDKWKSIKKNTIAERSAGNIAMADTFTDELDDSIDISNADAMNTIKLEEDKHFLLMQRQKGRPGCIGWL